MEKIDQLFAKLPADEPDQSFQYYLDRSGEDDEVNNRRSDTWKASMLPSPRSSARVRYAATV